MFDAPTLTRQQTETGDAAIIEMVGRYRRLVAEYQQRKEHTDDESLEFIDNESEIATQLEQMPAHSAAGLLAKIEAHKLLWESYHGGEIFDQAEEFALHCLEETARLLSTTPA